MAGRAEMTRRLCRSTDISAHNAGNFYYSVNRQQVSAMYFISFVCVCVCVCVRAVQHFERTSYALFI